MFAFGKLIQVVHEIDEQKFLGESLRKGRLHAKCKLPPAEQKITVPFVIVHDGLVIELRRANAETVVRIGRSEKKPVVFQKSFDKLVIFCRCFPKHGLLRIGVKTARKLCERPLFNQLF